MQVIDGFLVSFDRISFQIKNGKARDRNLMFRSNLSIWQQFH